MSSTSDIFNVPDTAYFRCPQSRTTIFKHGSMGEASAAEIADHKATCPYCIEKKAEIDAEKQARIDGIRRMRYILDIAETYKRQIESLEKKIEKEKREKLQSYEIEIRMAKREIEELKNKIQNERVEKFKLLNHENENTRKAARETYDKWLNATEKQRRYRDY